jgi:Ca2+-binding EF-hand superfamily protein
LLLISIDEKALVAALRHLVRTELNLCAVSKSDIKDSLMDGECSRKKIENLIASAWSQQAKAEQVFRLLDRAEKGVVILDDLQRVAVEILGEGTTKGELVEMIQAADNSGDSMLTRKDFCRLARTIDL